MFFETRARPRNKTRYIPVASTTVLNPPRYVSSEAAMRNSDIRTAITIISSDIARVKFRTPNKKINNLLNAPSRMTGRFSFMQSMIAEMLLSGNAYALRRTDGNKEFWEFAPPSRVNVLEADDGQSLVYEFRFLAPDEHDLIGKEAVQAKDVIHFRWLGTNGGLTGRSPLESLAKEINLQDQSRSLALSVFNKAITPTSFLKVPGKYKKEEKDKIRDAFVEQNTGDNAGKPLVLDSNVEEYKQLEVKADVAKLLESTDWTREQIAKVFMIPIDTLGSESQHSNAEQIRSQYNTTLGRYIAPLVDELELKLEVDVTPDVREAIDLDGSQIESRVKDMVSGGVISSPLGIEILLNSHSDLVDTEILTKVIGRGETVNGTVKKTGSTDDASTA